MSPEVEIGNKRRERGEAGYLQTVQWKIRIENKR